MLKLKRIGKAVVCLLCCLTCLLCVKPVSALTSSASLVTTTTAAIGAAPGVSVESISVASAGHLVSVVHYNPSAGSSVIGCLENGTRLTVLGSSGNFYKIDCYDMNGYIAMSQVAVNEAGEYYVNSVEDSAEAKYLNSYSAQEALELKSALLAEAQTYLGTRYRYTGSTPSGFDCSGYTYYVFGQIGIDLGRSTLNQMSDGVIIAQEDLQPGDLVIYSNTGRGGFASHVAIYIGNGQIIHSGTSTGVVIADMSDTYYQKRFQCARRVILSDVAAAASLPTMDTITGSVGTSWRGN